MSQPCQVFGRGTIAAGPLGCLGARYQTFPSFRVRGSLPLNSQAIRPMAMATENIDTTVLLVTDMVIGGSLRISTIDTSMITAAKVLIVVFMKISFITRTAGARVWPKIPPNNDAPSFAP